MKKLLPFLIVLLLFLASCSSERTGNFRIYLTDKPIDNAQQILVTISGIKVQKTGEAFIPLSNTVATYDLLKLRDKEKIMLDTELEQGTYTQIRLVVDSGQIVINNESHELIIPSPEVKIPVVFQVEKDGVTEIVLDFEAEHSINLIKAGQSRKYILRPVIRVKNIIY